MKPGLSITSRPTGIAALKLVRNIESSFSQALRSPAAENIAATVSDAFMAAAALFEFIETFEIPVDKFLPLARDTATGIELREALFKFIVENQKD